MIEMMVRSVNENGHTKECVCVTAGLMNRSGASRQADCAITAAVACESRLTGIHSQGAHSPSWWWHTLDLHKDHWLAYDQIGRIQAYTFVGARGLQYTGPKNLRKWYRYNVIKSHDSLNVTNKIIFLKNLNKNWILKRDCSNISTFVRGFSINLVSFICAGLTNSSLKILGWWVLTNVKVLFTDLGARFVNQWWM